MADVKYIHLRRMVKGTNQVSSHGGVTVAYIPLTKDAVTTYVCGAAQCSDSDRFVKAVGRAKSAGRIQSRSQHFTVENVTEHQLVERMTMVYGKKYKLPAQ